MSRFFCRRFSRGTALAHRRRRAEQIQEAEADQDGAGRPQPAPNRFPTAQPPSALVARIAATSTGEGNKSITASKTG